MLRFKSIVGVGRLFAAVYSDPDEKHQGYPRDVAYVPKDGLLPEMYERREPQVSRRLADVLLGDETLRPPFPGPLRYLAWTATARFLRPVVNAFDAWRDEERWLRRYCPTCGSLPAMAQLVGVDPGRRRLLSCGCCGTRWRYRRIGCPFCESADGHRLSALAIEGEKSLRIDYCQSCRAYLKTYDGEGYETFFLADWTRFTST